MLHIATVEKQIIYGYTNGYTAHWANRETSCTSFGIELYDAIRHFYAIVKPFGLDENNLVFMISKEVVKKEN
jgi:hypothetical protein